MIAFPERGMGTFTLEKNMIVSWRNLMNFGGWDENGVPLPDTLEKFSLPTTFL